MIDGSIANSYHESAGNPHIARMVSRSKVYLNIVIPNYATGVSGKDIRGTQILSPISKLEHTYKSCPGCPAYSGAVLKSVVTVVMSYQNVISVLDVPVTAKWR